MHFSNSFQRYQRRGRQDRQPPGSTGAFTTNAAHKNCRLPTPGQLRTEMPNLRPPTDRHLPKTLSHTSLTVPISLVPMELKNSMEALMILTSKFCKGNRGLRNRPILLKHQFMVREDGRKRKKILTKICILCVCTRYF